jgi:ABC-2 type transport system ATP-binding protein
MTRPAVQISSVSKHFHNAKALDAVSFDVPAGSLFALIGPNGAGKTTLFSIASGILRPTAGTISVLGIDVANQVSALRGRFSLLPQDAQFLAHVPIVEQLELFCRLQGLDVAGAQRAALAALDIVGLADMAKRRARQLSHGMGKRLAIAQAFLGDPEVVFLDEPTSGLDPENAANIRRLVRSYRGDRTIVISSHNLPELQQLCDHMAILDKGRLVRTGSMADFLGSGHTVRISFSKAASEDLVAALRGLPAISEVARGHQEALEIHFSAGDADAKDAALSAILALSGSMGFVPRAIEEGQRLEERFLAVTGGRTDGLGST